MIIKFKTRAEARKFASKDGWKFVDFGTTSSPRWGAKKVGVIPVSLEGLVRKLKSSRGGLFTAKFVKADGSIRTLNGRIGVHSKTTGGMKKYNGLFEDAGNIGVYDVQAKGYRSIKAKNLFMVKVGGAQYKLASEV